ncbi:Myb-like_DNA-binding domain-containing protein [Hexamita inflata]|uniref:Myb-like DNA-binding domain-containing protein n=1 Tax=Hexamita inflata TaxID=28002 RepID=A0AA86NWJ5_9EUKA|nr:Myb-like DNA-binding domain-containing protein [Hexamita inflata]
MDQNQQKQYYDYWTEEDQVKLLKAIRDPAQNKRNVDWKLVAQVFENKSAAKCKSYYQFFQKKQNECVDLWLKNKSYMPQISKRLRIHIGVYTQFYNFDWDFIQKQHYNKYTVEELKQAYVFSLRMFQFQRQILYKCQNNIQIDYPVIKLKEMCNDIIEVIYYIKLYKRILMHEIVTDTVDQNQLYQDAPKNEALLEQIDPLIADYYIDFASGFDLELCAANLKRQIEAKLKSQ